MDKKENIYDSLADYFTANRSNIYDMIEMKEGITRSRCFTTHSPCKNSYSISKNFTAAAVGMLIGDGLLSLEDKAHKFFTEKELAPLNEKFFRVTLRHLLTHTTGETRGYLFEGDRYLIPEKDWIKYCLSKPLSFEPGEKMAYSNSNYYLLSVICERVSGKTLYGFLNRRLFQPLDFEGAVWEQCPAGHTMGATGLYIRTEDLIKLGSLFLNFGQYGGKSYLSEGFVKEAQTPQFFKNYGLSFWLDEKRGLYYGDGAHSQKLIIDNANRCVTAVHAYDDIPYDRILCERS